jgi:hypothetical protein
LAGGTGYCNLHGCAHENSLESDVGRVGFVG